MRFRLSDTRAVDLYHKSSIVAGLKDLEKFNLDCTLKPKVTIYNKKLKKDIEVVVKAMTEAYHALCEKMDKTHISGELFEQEVAKILNPEISVVVNEKESMISRFSRFISDGFKEGNFNEKRMKSYEDLLRGITRFLKIKHLEKISADEFSADLLKELSEFFKDEYLYVPKHKRLYANLPVRQVPTQERHHNTIVTRLNKVQAFFNELLDQEELEISPFMKLGRKRHAKIMREEYPDDPINLTIDELYRIIDADVPEFLAETRDAFIVQCALGCRINEFQQLCMAKVAVTEDGIPYVHYLPSKTKRENTKKVEIQTPIIRYAFDLIMKYQFNFRILKYVSGKSGYNVKIRELLKHCEINREVKVYNREIDDNEFYPIHERASSKMCRATNEDLMRVAQVNLFTSGLHAVGSDAIHHYTRERLGELFARMCYAYRQPIYRVDKNLNVIEEVNADDEGKRK